MKNMPKVIHLPTSTGNNAYYLSKAEKKFITSHTLYAFISKKSNIYDNTEGDYNLSLSSFRLFSLIKLTIIYIKIIFKYDVFHFNSGKTLTAMRSSLLSLYFMRIELMILKLLKKKIIVTFQGSDARQSNYCIINYKFTHYNNPHVINNLLIDERKRKKIRIFDRFADLMYTTQPDLKNVLPDRTNFRALTKIDVCEIHPNYNNYNSNKPFVIVHAPSNRLVKGTQIIEAAINQLIDEGYSINFHLIENISNKSALKIYAKADLAIDQIFVGWYGGFAVELMALGKPVMCYVRESDMIHIPIKMKNEMPIINTNPENITNDLRKVINNRHELNLVAKKSRIFVENWHDINKIARNIMLDYKLLYLNKH